MENPTKMPDHQYYLSMAVAKAKTLAQMQAVWRSFGPRPHKEALPTIIENAIGMEGTPLVSFLDSLGKMSDATLVGLAWKRAACTLERDLIKQLLSHEGFRRIVREDASGAMLMACMEVGFQGQRAKLLEKVAALGPPQPALDSALAHVVMEAPDKSSRDGWDKAFTALLAHGANPFARVERKVADGLFVFSESTLFVLAKEAIRITGRAGNFLRGLVAHHPAHAVLSYREGNRHFVGMWGGGQGDREELVHALAVADEQGANWRAGDPYGVLFDALRLGCINAQDPVFAALLQAPRTPLPTRLPSDKIAPIIDQAFRIGMKGQTGEESGLDDIFEMLMSKDKTPETIASAFAHHRKFWERVGEDLAYLFEDPQAWKTSCQQVQAALHRTSKASSEETEAVLSAIALANQTASSPARKSGLRL